MASCAISTVVWRTIESISILTFRSAIRLEQCHADVRWGSDSAAIPLAYCADLAAARLGHRPVSALCASTGHAGRQPKQPGTAWHTDSLSADSSSSRLVVESHLLAQLALAHAQLVIRTLPKLVSDAFGMRL